LVDQMCYLTWHVNCVMSSSQKTASVGGGLRY
jgi:hypothetical protein